MDFSKQYLFKAPKIKFATQIYHPHIKVGNDNGEDCVMYKSI